MPSSTSDHGHSYTYPANGATGWNSTLVTLFQAISDDMDSIGTTEITKIDDSAGNTVMTFSKVSSAINYVDVLNSATGAGPEIAAKGDDTNVDLTLKQKGSGDIGLTSSGSITLTATGVVTFDGLVWPSADGTADQVMKTDGSGNLAFTTIVTELADDTSPQLAADLDLNGFGVDDTNGNEMLTFTVAASAVNQLDIGNAATGSEPTITAAGGDTNIDVAVRGKGTGGLDIERVTFDSGSNYRTDEHIVKAWISFDGATPAVNDSHGVTSLTDLGAGTWRVNLSTTMSNANYAVVLGHETKSDGADNSHVYYNTVTTSSFIITSYDQGGTGNGVDFDLVSAIVIGDQ